MARNELKGRQGMSTVLRAHSATNSGFTLIEIIVVTTLSVLLMIGAVGLFYTTIVSSTKKNVITTIKDQGDYAIGQMEFLLRNAVSLQADPSIDPLPGQPLLPICAKGMSSITLKSADNGITTLFVDGGRIASRSATTTLPKYLTGTDVILSGPTFDCVQASANLGSYVTISFSLRKDTVDINTPQPVKEDFTTSINIRSF